MVFFLARFRRIVGRVVRLVVPRFLVLILIQLNVSNTSNTIWVGF